MKFLHRIAHHIPTTVGGVLIGVFFYLSFLYPIRAETLYPQDVLTIQAKELDCTSAVGPAMLQRLTATNTFFPNDWQKRQVRTVVKCYQGSQDDFGQAYRAEMQAHQGRHALVSAWAMAEETHRAFNISTEQVHGLAYADGVVVAVSVDGQIKKGLIDWEIFLYRQRLILDVWLKISLLVSDILIRLIFLIGLLRLDMGLTVFLFLLWTVVIILLLGMAMPLANGVGVIVKITNRIKPFLTHSLKALVWIIGVLAVCGLNKAMGGWLFLGVLLILAVVSLADVIESYKKAVNPASQKPEPDDPDPQP